MVNKTFISNTALFLNTLGEGRLTSREARNLTFSNLGMLPSPKSGKGFLDLKDPL